MAAAFFLCRQKNVYHMKNIQTKARPFYVNEIGEVYPVLNGRFGRYATMSHYGRCVNVSDRAMQKQGFEVREMTPEGVADCAARLKEREDHLRTVVICF